MARRVIVTRSLAITFPAGRALTLPAGKQVHLLPRSRTTTAPKPTSAPVRGRWDCGTNTQIRAPASPGPDLRPPGRGIGTHHRVGQIRHAVLAGRPAEDPPDRVRLLARGVPQGVPPAASLAPTWSAWTEAATSCSGSRRP